MAFCFSPLFSSSQGNASFVSTEKTRLLVDAGLTGSSIKSVLSSIGEEAARLSGIIVTHEHIDHIKGVGVLSRMFDLPVYANERTWCEMEYKIGGVASKNIRVIDEHEFYVGDMCVKPVRLSHDAADPFGYVLMSGGKKIGILTDTGRVTAEEMGALKGCSIVMLEANHDVEMLRTGPYPYYLKQRVGSARGHLSNLQAGEASVELYKNGVRGIVLGHISAKNNHKKLALQTVRDALTAADIQVGKDIALMAANRTSVTGVFSLK